MPDSRGTVTLLAGLRTRSAGNRAARARLSSNLVARGWLSSNSAASAGHAGGPTSDNPDAPPYGVRFRLAAAFDETPFSEGERVILRALKTHGMLLSDGGEIALTFADDAHTTAKWADLGVDARSFAGITPADVEVVDLGPEIEATYDCVR
ncbi:hypothetical protein [Pseudonocardia lacus]|uniref:hypothetical protein n=1 Tax=Pseudonocardia lacus TaxID=2835865 RepID=UPI001BDD4675|nr:hypothetical protein [Pseudonocardia lacus]